MSHRVLSMFARLQLMMDKDTDYCHKEKNKKYLNESSNDEKVKEEKNRKNREKCKRYRERKKNKDAAVPFRGPLDSEEEKREEERKQRNREKTRRYREKKKNELEAALSMTTADSSSDSFGTKYAAGAGSCTRYVPPVLHSSTITDPSSSHSIHSIEDRVLQHPLIDNLSDHEKIEEDRRKNREKCKRYRERKKNKVGTASISEISDPDEKRKEEERKQKNREKVKRYRENKKKMKEIERYLNRCESKLLVSCFSFHEPIVSVLEYNDNNDLDEKVVEIVNENSSTN